VDVLGSLPVGLVLRAAQCFDEGSHGGVLADFVGRAVSSWLVPGEVCAADGAAANIARGVEKAGEAEGMTAGERGWSSEHAHADRTDQFLYLALHYYYSVWVLIRLTYCWGKVISEGCAWLF
jgi:hypothetical protein